MDFSLIDQLKEFGVVEKKIRGPRNGTRIPEIKSIKISKCDVCSIIVKTTAALDEHKVHMHSDDRRFPCLQCTTAFKTKSDLTKHVRRVHELQRNAKCPLCIKSKSQTQFNNYIILHHFLCLQHFLVVKGLNFTFNNFIAMKETINVKVTVIVKKHLKTNIN